MTNEVAPPPDDTKASPAHSKDRTRWLRWALVLSLGLNLLILGMIGGAMVRHQKHPPYTVSDVGFGPFTEALSSEDRRALRDAFVERSPGIRDVRREVRADFAVLLSALRAPTWDEAGVRAALEAQRSRTVERIVLGQDLLLERIGQMSAKDRRAFADRLESVMRRPSRGDFRN